MKQSSQKSYTIARLSKKITFSVAELLPAFLILIIPFSVHAGFFSKIFSVFAEEAVAQVELDAIDHSPQNTPLLSAIKNPDPQKAIGGGDISFEDGALFSSGPVSKDDIAASSMNKGEISVYTVTEGDALSYIAQMYDVTVNTIIWANDLNSASDIAPGDTLVILPIVGVRHVVAKGETLASIIKKYDANLEEVLQYNNLSSAENIAIGNELMIPGGELHTAKAVGTSATPTKTSGKVAGTSWLSHPVPGAKKTQGIHGYNGVDLGAKSGTAIHAAAAGQVIVSKSSGWNGGYGQYIVIKHNNGSQTLYAHLSSNSVGVGAWVEQGQVIGGMGSTGKSTGVHLHFEVRGASNPF